MVMNKNTSYRSSVLLKKLNEKEVKFFTIDDAQSILRSNREATKRLLIYMADRGLILRIKDGLYNIIPYEKEPEKYFPNWHLTAERLVYPTEYYIGFYSAMDIHGLITQPSLVEQIVTQKQFHPKTRTIRNVEFEFITLHSKRFFGFTKVWINNYEKVFCSDLEKTIIDSLYKTNYAGGIVEIVKAIYRAKDKIDSGKMLKYLERFETLAVNKRLGFILSELGLFEDLRKKLNKTVTNSYALLDTALPKNGKYNSNWKVIDNVGIEEAVNSIGT